MHLYLFTRKPYPDVQTSTINVESHISSTSYAPHTLQTLFGIIFRVT